MNNFAIRSFQINDIDIILDIFRTNVPYYFAPEEIKDLQNYLENELEDYFVILQNDKIIGSGGINYDNDKITARLSWDFIDKSIQQKGAGSALAQYRINHVFTLNHIQRLIVRTSQYAEGFYKKQGFCEISRIKDYWSVGYDMVYMEYARMS